MQAELQNPNGSSLAVVVSQNCLSLMFDVGTMVSGPIKIYQKKFSCNPNATRVSTK